MHKLFKKDCLSSLFFYFYLIFKTILKPQIMKKITLFFLSALLSFSVKAQELEILLLANGDANQLLQNYMAPVMNGMQYSLNNGWYHTAKTHKKLGFDITVGMNASIVPNASKSFLFSPG